MGRFMHLINKAISAWSSGTLRARAGRFLITTVRRPVEVTVGYVRLSRADRNLNIRDGFADHRPRPYHRTADHEQLRRIIRAYQASKEAQRQAAPPFQIKGLWEEWISVNHKKSLDAFAREDVAALATLFENMFREQFTTGTGGYDDYVRYHTLWGGPYIKYVWSSYRDKLQALGFDVGKSYFPPIGNPAGVLLNGNVIPIETLRHAYHAVEMCQLLRDVPRAVIAEIGGGLGGQAFQTLHLCGGTVARYLVFDIPEVAAISAYFLLSAFPGKRVRLFGEGPVSADPREEYDIAVFPHFAAAQIAGSSVDLFYNSCSFSEMDGLAAREYLSIIERACRRYFMHVNHDTPLKFRNADGSLSANVIGSDLVPSPVLFKRIFKKPRVHGLPEDRSFAYFEYLYERF